MRISALRLLATQDRVLVRVDDDPAASLDPGDPDGSLVIPEAHRRFSRRGTVLASGCGHWSKKNKWVPTELQPGDRVLLPLSADGMAAYDIGGREHRILREHQILGVIE